MVKAVYPISARFGIEILDANNSYVIWRWSNENEVRKSIVHGNRFRANRIWISLDDCMTFDDCMRV